MNLSAGVKLHRFDMGKHAGFVFASFTKSLRDFGTVGALYLRQHVYQLERELRGGLGATVVASPIGEPDTMLGWAHADCGSLVYAYTIADCRKWGIGSVMAGGLFSGGPVPVVYWTVLAQEIADHGFPVIHDFDEYVRRERAAQRATRRYIETIAERTIRE